MANKNSKFLDYVLSKILIFIKNIVSKKEKKSLKNIVKCIFESLVYTFIILILIYFLPFTNKNFLNLNLHPLAIMVVLMSLKYGTYLGFVNAFIATLGYLFAYLHSGNDMILFLLKFQYYKFFLMFLFISMLMGRLHSNHKVKIEELKNEKEKIEILFEDEKRKNVEVLNINFSLRNKIIQTKNGIISFQKFRKKLRKASTFSEIYEIVMDFLNKYLSCENASVFIKKENHLEQILKIGNSNLKSNLKLNDENSERFLEVLNKKCTLEFTFDLNGKVPMFIAPIFLNGDIISFIEVTKLSYESSKSYTFEIFKILITEVNESMEKISK